MTHQDNGSRISVIGTGYLGATHAACLAELGFEVLGVDRDAEKIGLLASGIVPFREPGLDAMGRQARRLGPPALQHRPAVRCRLRRRPLRLRGHPPGR